MDGIPLFEHLTMVGKIGITKPELEVDNRISFGKELLWLRCNRRYCTSTLPIGYICLPKTLVCYQQSTRGIAQLNN